MYYQLNYVINNKCFCRYFKTYNGAFLFLKKNYNSIQAFRLFDMETLEELIPSIKEVF